VGEKLLGHPAEVFSLDLPHFLWIELLRQRGEADEVAEERRDQPSLFLGWSGARDGGRYRDRRSRRE
jgi:hypothetical protein